VKEREYKKFVMYSIYAWGSPFFMLTVCVIMDFVPSVPNYLIKPQFGVTKCWFRSKYTVKMSVKTTACVSRLEQCFPTPRGLARRFQV
jgi:hypothetical protein